jgi:hypothetical protein
MVQHQDVRRADTRGPARRSRGSRRGLAFATVGAFAALGALTPLAGAAVNTLTFAGPVPGTVANTGFTTALTGSTVDASKVSVSNGLSITSDTGGDAYLGLNDQENAFALPVDPGPLGYEARVDVALPNPASATFQSAGVVIGRDQDNYVKLVLSVRPQGGTIVTALNFLHESGGTPAAVSNRSLNTGAASTLTLILTVAPGGTVTPSYQLDGGPRTAISAGASCLFGSAGCVNETASDPALLTAGTTAGVISTNYDDPDVPGVTPGFTALFRNFVLDNPNQAGAAPVTPPVVPPGAGPLPGPDRGAVPKIVAVAPGPNGEVARRGRMILEFDRPVRVPSSAVRLVRGNGRVVPSTTAYVPRLRQLVITPSRPMPLTGGMFLAVSGGTNPAAIRTATGVALATNSRYKLKVVRRGALPLRGIDLRGRLLDLVLTSNARPKAITARQGATLPRTRTTLRVVRRNGKNWTVTTRPSSANRYVRIIQRRPGTSPLRTAVFLPR